MEELAAATQILQAGPESPSSTTASPTPATAEAPKTDPATPPAGSASKPEGETPAAPAESSKEKAQQERIASKFAALSKKERDLTIREQGLSQREKKVQELEAKLKRGKENPDEGLEALGLTYEEITEFKLKGKVPESAKQRELEQKLKDAEEREAKKKQDDEKAEEDRKTQAYRDNVTQVVKGKGDEFELINQFERHDLVYDVMVEMFKKDKSKVPEITEAAAKVEKHLEAELAKHKGSKKLASLFGAQAAEPAKTEPKPEATEAGKIAATKTLTNAQSQAATETVTRSKSEEEEFLDAVKLLST